MRTIRYIHAASTTGYTIATHQNREPERIVEEFSDEESEQWPESIDYETTL